MNSTCSSILLAATAVLALVTTESRATLIGSESIQTDSATDTYTSGSSFIGTNSTMIVGNYGFSNSSSLYQWQSGTGSITSTNTVSLTHNGLTGTAQVGSVKLLEFYSGGALSRNSFRLLTTAPVTASSYYLSGLVRGNTLSSMTDGSAISAGFTQNGITSTTFNTTVGFHLGLRKSGGVTYLAAFAGGSEYNLAALDASTINTTFQIVLKLDVSATGNEVLSAWYAADGDSNLTVALASIDIGGSSWANAYDLRALILQTRNVSGTTSQTAGYLDEIRFGTSLADVTSLSSIPEPSTVALMLGSVAGAFGLMRRRRTSAD